MRGGTTFLLGGAAALALAACDAGQGQLAVRAIERPIASGTQPIDVRVAEGRGHFALGNIGLALESFRKAHRDDPNSVDALNGIAACYDRMGRFDLSRRHYEMALAIDPADPRLYANLATSLDMQGKRQEAASVRGEMAERLAAYQALAKAELPEAPAAVAVAPVATIAAAPALPPTIGRVAVVPAQVMALTAPRIQPRPAVPPTISVLAALPAQVMALTAPRIQPRPAVPPTISVLAALPAPVLALAAPVIRPQPVMALASPAPVQPPLQIAAAPATAPVAAKSVTVALPPPKPAAAPVPQAPVVGVGSVTVKLDPPRPAAAPKPAPRQAAVRSTAAEPAPRLLRLSSGEVALVTSKAPVLQRLEPQRLAIRRPRKPTAPIVLLNAARHQGLAARTRVFLATRGWRRIEIGDAPRVHARSVILYPAARREQARRLAAQFGFAIRHGPSSSDRLTILLGKDAAARRWLKARSA